jgi:hypothetical protein
MWQESQRGAMESQLAPSDVELDATELIIPFSFFDLYSWWFFWSYKRYKIVFKINTPAKEFYRLDSCSAVPKAHIEGETKEEWWLLANFTKMSSDCAFVNQITITIPYSKQHNRITFVPILNPPKSMAIAIKTQN